MTTTIPELTADVAAILELSADDAVRQGLRSLVPQRLRQVSAEIAGIAARWSVADVHELESRMREGAVPEADARSDLQSLDRLEYRRDRLIELLGRIGDGAELASVSV